MPQDLWGDVDYEIWSSHQDPDSEQSQIAQRLKERQQQEEEENIEISEFPWGSPWRLRAAVCAAIGDMIRLNSSLAEEEETMNVLLRQRATPVGGDVVRLLHFWVLPLVT